MSLTSYRAAPPRVNLVFSRGAAALFLRCRSWLLARSVAAPPRVNAEEGLRVSPLGGPLGHLILVSLICERGAVWRRVRGGVWVEEGAFVFCRSGNDLLSRVLRHSTIGAEAFNGRVRDGIGFYAPRSDHRTGKKQQALGLRRRRARPGAWLPADDGGRAVALAGFARALMR